VLGGVQGDLRGSLLDRRLFRMFRIWHQLFLSSGEKGNGGGCRRKDI